ncbi:MAG: VWA domain-containing protein [Phycisphaerales bacterium]|nr:VWA domain-containing protein [Phycisphaerae bacterium]NNF42268.1 VWA domain-containing protein [Phycisphaerales bacterium]NNM25766.1 VWA domain-containing protein [Phycisphaerales bacterium]
MSRRRGRRELDVLSLSILDCICCGFGAVILLFVLSKVSEPVRIEVVQDDLSEVVAELQEQIYEIVGETDVLNRELRGKREQVSEITTRIARLQGDLSALQGEFAASSGDAAVQTTIEGHLAAAYQELTDEMRRLLATQPRRRDATVGGIPIDSEYIVFIIDTSGSMQRDAWPLVIRKMQETLELYPRVKGIQVMNDLGNYMFPQYRGAWIPDSPARRRAILSVLSTWRPLSNSSPVEGIEAAIRTFYDGRKKISLYIFGDDFSGGRAQPVVDTIDTLNAADETGTRRVRIHAVGFPVIVDRQASGQRFSTLMRALCERNGGTFVGLNGLQP